MTSPENKSPNEGEGNRTAAKEYNKSQKDFAKSGKVEDAAKKAREAVEGSEGEELREAEEKGRSQARETDPAVTRDKSDRK